MSDFETQPTTPETAVAPPATLGQKSRMIIISTAVLLLDQLTKYMIEARMPLNTMWEPFPAIGEIFRFTHVANTGTAFGLFPNGSFIFGLLAVLVGLFLLYYNHILPGNQNTLRVALGLQLGGATGNLIDRIRLGHVTDFFDVGPWPIFNIADMAIVGGVIVLGWLMVQEARQERAQTTAETAEPPSTHERTTDSTHAG